jgi:hypothetical protein
MHFDEYEIYFMSETGFLIFSRVRGDNPQGHKKQLDMLVDLKGKIASSSNQSETISHNFDEMSPGLLSSFEKSIGQAWSDNETFKYWDTFICLIQQVKNVMEIGHCICRHFRPFFPSLQPLIPQII